LFLELCLTPLSAFLASVSGWIGLPDTILDLCVGKKLGLFVPTVSSHIYDLSLVGYIFFCSQTLGRISLVHRD